MKQFTITDVTLCKAGKGETMSFREKLQAAKTLEAAGIDRLSLPARNAGKADEIVWRTVAENVSCTVAMPAGATTEEADAAWACVKNAKKPCLVVAFPVSTVTMEYQYHMKSAAMVEKISSMVAYAKTLCADVEFRALDATRAEDGVLAACCKAAADNGAAAVTICDDNGTSFPEDYPAMIAEIQAVCNVPVYVMPSDALGMASACAISAIRAGASGIVVSADGEGSCVDIGRFADLYRAKADALDITCGINLTAVHKLAEKVSDGAAAEEADVDKVQDTDTFDESAEEGDIAAAVKALGYELSVEDQGKVWDEFRRVVDKKTSIGMRELEAIVASTAMQVPTTYHLVSYVVNSGNIITATATVALEKDGERFNGVSIGDGPIDAAFHAIEQIIGHHYELDDFHIQAVTKGREAVGSALIRLRADGKLYAGNGVSTDIIGACVRAYVNALNKIVYEAN